MEANEVNQHNGVAAVGDAKSAGLDKELEFDLLYVQRKQELRDAERRKLERELNEAREANEDDGWGFIGDVCDTIGSIFS